MCWTAKTHSCIFIKLKILEKLIAGAFNNDNEALLSYLIYDYPFFVTESSLEINERKTTG